LPPMAASSGSRPTARRASNPISRPVVRARVRRCSAQQGVLRAPSRARFPQSHGSLTLTLTLTLTLALTLALPTLTLTLTLTSALSPSLPSGTLPARGCQVPHLEPAQPARLFRLGRLQTERQTEKRAGHTLRRGRIWHESQSKLTELVEAGGGRGERRWRGGW
jgi:hypothetical protein